MGMQYRTTSYAEGVFQTYWFEKNLQGDIVAVYNDAGTLFATYTYDAWGGTVSLRYFNGGSGTAATYNPFRYRGYYRDSETGFYYLNSRYYDPNTGRFINEDGQLNMDNLLGTNLYAYCGNNPVIYLDYLGDMWQFVPQLDPRNRYYGAGGSGFSGGSWDSSAYNTYQIRCRTQYYDAQLLGYYFEGSFNAGFGNISYYMVPGAVTVTDGVASVSSGSSMLQARPSNIVKYPGDDSTIAPGPDFE